ncbi:hypothetical protein OS176_06175 [Xanthomonadaceae bacterium XH05]|nr:hypothetical protein [Xanthomonadaceae bacterium XH05]
MLNGVTQSKSTANTSPKTSSLTNTSTTKPEPRPHPDEINIPHNQTTRISFMMKKIIQLISIAIILALLSGGRANAQPSLPGITVTAINVNSGGYVVCRGEDCRAILSSLVSQNMYQYTHMPMGDGGGGGDGIFCGMLSARKPDNCGASAPSVPGLDPNWAPNGCGDRSISSHIASFLIAVPLNVT